MSSFAFMKLLETKATRYDRGMELLTLGRIGSLYERAAGLVPQGSRVLEVGCGTGGVTSLLVQRGCEVVAFDSSPSMLRVAEHKLSEVPGNGQVELRHLSITEMDRAFPEEAFDCLVCCLVLSELTIPEQDFALDQFRRVLHPAGCAIIADEVPPPTVPKRLCYLLQRVPMNALAYLFTQTTTHRVRDVPGRLRARGMEIADVTYRLGGAFQITEARRTP